MLWALYTTPFYFLPLCYGLTIILSLRRLWSGQDQAVEAVRLLVALFGLFLFRSVWGRPDMPHLQGNSLPVTFSVAGFLDSLWLTTTVAAGRPSALRTPARLLAAVVGLVAFGFCFYPNARAIRQAREHTFPVAMGLHPRTTTPDWPEAWSVVNYLDTHSQPSDTVFCVSTCPFFYVLSDRDNATQFDYFDPIIITEVEDDTVRELRQSPPRFCVVQRKNLVWRRQFGQDYGQSIQRWVDQNYRPVRVIGNFLVMEPKNLHTAKNG